MKVLLTTNVIDDLIGKRLTLDLGESQCLQSLFNKIAEIYGKKMEERLFTKGKLKSNLTILVNGRAWSSSDLEKELPQPCEVCVFQMLAGG